MNIGDLYFTFRGDATRLPADAKKAGWAAGSSFSSSLKQGLGIGGGFAVAQQGIQMLGEAIGGTLTSAIEFEKAMANVNSIAGMTGDELASTSDAVLELSKEFGQSAQTLAEGLYDISSSGFQGADALDVLTASTKAATAGLSTTAEAASGITAVLNAYGESAEEANHVSDVLFETVNRGVITFPELSAQIGKTTALSAPLGVSLEEVAAAAALMTRNGVQAEDTFTQINAVLNSMLQPSKEAADLAKSLGLEWNATGLRTKGLVGQMNDLIEKTGGSAEQMATLLGDSRAIRGAFVLAKNAGKDFTDELGAMQDAAGATDKAFKIQSKSTAFQIAQMQASIEAARIELGEKFLPVLAGLAEVSKDVVVPALEDAAGALDALGAVAVTVGDAVDTLTGKQKDAADESFNLAGAVGTVVDTLNPTHFTQRVGSALDIVDALGVSTAELRTHINDLGIDVPTATDKVATGFDDMRDEVDPDLHDVKVAVTEVGTASKSMERKVNAATSGALGSFEAFRDAVINAARDIVNKAFQLISDKAELTAVNVEKAELRKVIATGKATKEQKDRYRELTESQAQLILDLAENGAQDSKVVATAIAQLEKDLKTATGPMKTAIQTTINALKRLQAQARRTAASVRNAVNISNTYSGPLSGGHQQRAVGGVATRGTTYQWQERGPMTELFTPNVTGRIANMAEIQAALNTGGGGGDTYNIPVQVAGALPVETISDIAFEMQRLGKRGVLPKRLGSPQYKRF